MSIIQTHSLTVTQALQSCFYRVPEYQREYVWTAEEAVQLLDDINESIGDDGRQYFVGTVLVAPDDSKQRSDELDLIDGQQRTTTFYLILCALRRRFLRRPQQPAIEALLATSYTDIDGNTVSRLRLEPCYENATELVDFLRQFDGDDAELCRHAVRLAADRQAAGRREVDRTQQRRRRRIPQVERIDGPCACVHDERASGQRVVAGNLRATLVEVARLERAERSQRQ